MPVKWHCPVTLSNARECFFSENGQTSLVTCTMTNVVKHMTHLILPRGPHRPWMGPVHPSPAPEFRTPRLPVIAVTAPRTTLPGRKLAVPGGLQRLSIHPPAVSSQRSLAQSTVSLSATPPPSPCLCFRYSQGNMEEKEVSSECDCSGKLLSSLSTRSPTLLQEHPSSLGCFWVRCLI